MDDHDNQPEPDVSSSIAPDMSMPETALKSEDENTKAEAVVETDLTEPTPVPQDANYLLSMEKVRSIRVELRAVLGRTKLPVSRIMSLENNELIILDTCIGDEIELYANDSLLGYGEIVVLETQPPSFGITLKRLVEQARHATELR